MFIFVDVVFIMKYKLKAKLDLKFKKIISKVFYKFSIKTN